MLAEMKQSLETRNRWLVRIDSPREPALRLQALLRILARGEVKLTRQSQVPCVFIAADGVSPSLDVLWRDQSIHDAESRALPVADAAVEFALSLDHVALCTPSSRRAGCLQQLRTVLGEHGLDDSDDLQSIQAAVEFLHMGHAGMDINIISPRVRVPHLAAFLDEHQQGGVLHIGLAVSSMLGSLEACRQTGIETLAERIGGFIDRGLVPEGDPLRALAQTGYAEELGTDGRGYLRQTFVFPWNTPGAPFIELVERQTFSGYGEASSPLLLRALDLRSSTVA